MQITLPILLVAQNGKTKIETIEVFDKCQKCGAARYKVDTGKMVLEGVEHKIEVVKATCGHRQNWSDLYIESEAITMLAKVNVNINQHVCQ